tara:strand:+ start:127 stop:276 length:150 start_codon:yes stop_codon:yes gene_type:complete
MKNGKNLEWEKNLVYQEESLKWFADSTAPTSDINIIYLAPAHQEPLIYG